ncbi:MAG TPA: S8 family serine peptidase [Methylomirabilota bacterium]|nr:S8 family serine peptidase [Methylomirabilota bacterium]
MIRRALLVAWLLLLPAAGAAQCGGVCEQGPPQRPAPVGDKTGLTPAQQKVAPAIRELAGAVQLRVQAGAGGLATLSTPAVRVDDAGAIQVYVVLVEFRPEYVAQLTASGLQVELTLPEFQLVQGWLPAAQVDAVAALPFVTEVRPPGYPVRKVGAQLTAGDSILRADQARATFGLTGAGVTVGVMSDGVDHLASVVATGDLPAGVQVLKNPGGDEGTAILEILHDLAPGSGLAFYGPTTSADMVNGINALAAAGARVVVDDITFLDEPKFQDGMIAQTARTFATNGRLYVTAAGNERQRHYRAFYNRLTGQSFPTPSYPAVHDYGGGDMGNTLTLPAGCEVLVVLQWNNPNGAANDDFDLFLARSSDKAVLAASTGFQTGTQNAIEGIDYINTTGSSQDVFIAVAEFDLTTGNPSSLILDYFVYRTCESGNPLQYVTAADSLIGHAAVTEVLSVAAVGASSPTTVEFYSSRGPGSISFPASESRMVPQLAGVDCVTTEVAVLGFFFPPPFCGTSAAAPHVAGVAALLIQRNPALSSQQLRDLLTGTAVDLGPPGFDFDAGFGRVDALNATTAVDPPTLTVQLNTSAFHTGDLLILAATMTPGFPPTPVDGYVVVRLPGGSFLSFQVGGFVVPGIVPAGSNFIPFPFSGEILRYRFGGGEPIGGYEWLSGLAQPATLNAVSGVDLDPFTFAP